jgi:hypothetical protein
VSDSTSDDHEEASTTPTHSKYLVHLPQPQQQLADVWVAAVAVFGAADRIRAGEAEGGFILRDECISRVIKFDSKQKQATSRPEEV